MVGTTELPAGTQSALGGILASAHFTHSLASDSSAMSQGYPPPGGYPSHPATGYPAAGQPYPGYPPAYPTPAGQPYGYPPGAPGTQPPGAPPAGPNIQQQYYSMLQAQELAQLEAWFRSVDKDNSGSITAAELAQADFGGHRFGLETARKLIKVFDRDNSDSINFNEFAALHKFITYMQSAFHQQDRDRSGYLDYNETVQALAAGGFQFSPPVMQLLVKRFQSPDRPGQLSFEGFIQLSAFVGQMKSTFESLDPQRRGGVWLNLEQLVHIAAAF